MNQKMLKIQIKKDYKKICLGCYKTKEEAVLARKKAEKEIGRNENAAFELAECAWDQVCSYKQKLVGRNQRQTGNSPYSGYRYSVFPCQYGR